MILDKLLQICTDQEINGAAISEDVLDRLNANNDVVDGTPLYAIMHVKEAFNTLTTLDVDIRSDSVATIATSQTVHAKKEIALADLTLNSLHVIGKVDGNISERYLGAYFGITGSDPTTGIVDLWFTDKIPREARGG